MSTEGSPARKVAFNPHSVVTGFADEYGSEPERTCLACGVDGCNCDEVCLNCGSTVPKHTCPE